MDCVACRACTKKRTPNPEELRDVYGWAVRISKFQKLPHKGTAVGSQAQHRFMPGDYHLLRTSTGKVCNHFCTTEHFRDNASCTVFLGVENLRVNTAGSFRLARIFGEKYRKKAL